MTKELKDMTWEELTELRERLNTELTNTDQGEHGDSVEWLEQELLDALQAVQGLEEAKQPGEKKDAPKSPPKGYPSDKSGYADPTNYKYPLDTEAHARAALSYFSKPKNRGGYSPEEQKFIWKRIIRAARKYDIELSDDVKKHAEKLDGSDSVEGEVKEKMTEEEKEEGESKTPMTLEALGQEVEAFQKKHEDFTKAHEKSVTGMNDRMKTLEATVKEMKEELGKVTKAVKKFNLKKTKAEEDEEEEEEKTKADEEEEEKDSEEEEQDEEEQDEEEQDEEEDDDSDDEDDEEEEESEASKKKAKKAKAEEGAAENDFGPHGKTAKKPKRKVKEHVAQGLTATEEMAAGDGVTPPGFVASDERAAPSGFGDVMNRASRLRRGRTNA